MTTFTYDGDGLRPQTVTAAGTTNFIWDRQDVLLETDVSNNTQVTYTQTPDIYGNLVSPRRSTTTKYYHFDGLGSTLALTHSNENVTDTYRYYAFGESLTSSGATTNNLRFVGNLGYYNEAAMCPPARFGPTGGRLCAGETGWTVERVARGINTDCCSQQVERDYECHALHLARD